MLQKNSVETITWRRNPCRVLDVAHVVTAPNSRNLTANLCLEIYLDEKVYNEFGACNLT